MASRRHSRNERRNQDSTRCLVATVRANRPRYCHSRNVDSCAASRLLHHSQEDGMKMWMLSGASGRISTVLPYFNIILITGFWLSLSSVSIAQSPLQDDPYAKEIAKAREEHYKKEWDEFSTQSQMVFFAVDCKAVIGNIDPLISSLYPQDLTFSFGILPIRTSGKLLKTRNVPLWLDHHLRVAATFGTSTLTQFMRFGKRLRLHSTVARKSEHLASWVAASSIGAMWG
jgi:hypothetical protein